VVWVAPHKDFAVLIATNYGSESVAHDADKDIALLIENTIALIKREPLPEALGAAQKAVKAEETGAAKIQLDSLKSMDLRRKTALAKSWDTPGWVYFRQGDPDLLPSSLRPGLVGVTPLPATPTKDWCGGRESNPHVPYGTRDFKSLASTSSATPAQQLTRVYLLWWLFAPQASVR
jgi:hypothetical protein